MRRILLAFMILLSAGRLLAGAPPAVTEEEVENVIAESVLVFEAEFHKLKKVILYNDEVPTEKDSAELEKIVAALWSESEKIVFRTWNDDGTLWVEPEQSESENFSDDPFNSDSLGQVYDFDYITVSLGEDGKQFRESKIMISREITLKVTKVLKGKQEGESISIEFVDIPNSTCPHIVSMGNFKVPQRYFKKVKKTPSGEEVIYRYQPLVKK